MYNNFFGGGLPIAFSFSLVKNWEAYDRFNRMSDHEKRCVIEAAHSMTSRGEMDEYVNQLAHGHEVDR